MTLRQCSYHFSFHLNLTLGRYLQTNIGPVAVFAVSKLSLLSDVFSFIASYIGGNFDLADGSYLISSDLICLSRSVQLNLKNHVSLR